MLTRLAVAIISALIITGCASIREPVLPTPFKGDYSPITDYLTAVTKREMKASKLTGLSIALVDDQGIIWSDGFGFADKQNKVLANNKTKYRAASISKLFNATAVMKSVEQGRLSLDAPIVNSVSKFEIGSRFGSTDNITLRNLLTHQSGLPTDHVDGMWTSNPDSLDSVVDILKSVHVAFPANKLWSYSNIGVSLSGLAVQEQNDQAYEDYLYESILKPLQMVDSDFTGRLVGDRASLGYAKGRVVEELPIRDLPAGGLNTTVEDLANFMIAMLNNGKFKDSKVLESSTVKQMFETQNENSALDLSLRMGLGWIYQPIKLGGQYDIVGHHGATMGHSSQFWMVPQLGIGVVVLSNSFDPTQSNYRIALAGLEQLAATRGVKKRENTNDVVEHKPFTTGPEIEGDYASGYGVISIRRDKNKYRAKAMELNLSLTNSDGDWFVPKVKLGFLSLPSGLLGDIKVAHSVIDGHEVLVVMEEGVPQVVAERIEPRPESAIWNKRLGYYKNTNPGESKQFSIDGVLLKKADGFYILEIEHPLAGKVQLAVQPLSDDQLVDLGLGSGLGDTITYSDLSGVPTLTMGGRILELE